VNGHGGNVEPLAVTARELAHEFGLPVIACTPWFLTRAKVAEIAEAADTPAHACEGETSVMLAVAPELARTERSEDAVRQRPEPPARYRDSRRGYVGIWSIAAMGAVARGRVVSSFVWGAALRGGFGGRAGGLS
jgi:creatinine amidohydrolase